jgi:hypothetical protein
MTISRQLSECEKAGAAIVRSYKPQALLNAVFTCGRVRYQIAQTKSNVRNPVRIMETELWATAISCGTKKQLHNAGYDG